MMTVFSKRRRLMLLAVLVAVVPQTARAEDDGVLLKAKYHAGDRDYVEVKKTVRQTLGGELLGENFFSTRVEEVMGVLEEVKSVSDDKIAIQLTFDRTGQRIHILKNKWNFDSDTDLSEDNVIGRPMGTMVGKSVQMILDGNGRPKSLTGMNPIIADMDYASAGYTISAQFLREFKNVVTDDLMRLQWGDLTANLYPNRVVKPGETWTASVPVPVTFSGFLIRNYKCQVDKIVEVEGHKQVQISYQGTVENAPDSGPLVDANGQTVEFLSGEFNGTATFDAKRGHIIQQKEHLKESRLVHMGAPASAEQPNSITHQGTMVMYMDLELRRLTVEERKKEREARSSR